MKTVTGRIEYRDGLALFARPFVTKTVTSLYYHTHTPAEREANHAA